MSKPSASLYMRCVIACAGTVFIGWYLWSLAWHPLPLLWWIAVSLTCVLAIASAIRARSMLFWLPWCIMASNQLHQWLPWPSVKCTYIAPAVACAMVLFWPSATASPPRPRHATRAFICLFICLVFASVLGVLRQFVPTEPAAWHELYLRLRQVPFLDHTDRYIPLRLVWVWSLAYCLHLALRLRLRTHADVMALLWSMQAATVVIALLAMVSFVRKPERVCATFSSPAVLADIFTVCFILGIHMVRTCAAKHLRAVLYVMLALQTAAIVLTGCRINMLVLLILGMVWAWPHLHAVARMTPRQRCMAVVVALLLIAMATGIWLMAPIRVRDTVMQLPGVNRLRSLWFDSSRTVSQNIEVVLSGRTRFWRAALNIARAFPLWGIGCGMYEQNYNQYKVVADLYPYARVHNVFLRVVTEGGIVTLGALVVFLLAVWRVMGRHLGINATRGAPAGLARACAWAFAAIVFTSLTSDIWYETTECIMFLAMLAACGAFACHQAMAAEVPAEADDPDTTASAAPETEMDEDTDEYAEEDGGRRHLLSWETGKVLLAGMFLATLCAVGVRSAGHVRACTMRTDGLTFGYMANPPINNPEKKWQAIARIGATYTPVRQPVLFMNCRALNDRAARRSEYLYVYINNEWIWGTWLTSTCPTTVYCDMATLTGTVVCVRMKATRAFVPLKEHWFTDPRAYGAVVTPVGWTNAIPVEAARVRAGQLDN